MSHMQEWIDALKSGEYKQTTGCLKDNKGYCCLGVLSDLYIKDTGNANWHRDPGMLPDFFETTIPVKSTSRLRSTILPPVEVFEWLGEPALIQEDTFTNTQSSQVIKYLTALNDVDRVSFEVIASKLESIPELLSDTVTFMANDDEDDEDELDDEFGDDDEDDHEYDDLDDDEFDDEDDLDEDEELDDDDKFEYEDDL